MSLNDLINNPYIDSTIFPNQGNDFVFGMENKKGHSFLQGVPVAISSMMSSQGKKEIKVLDFFSGDGLYSYSEVNDEVLIEILKGLIFPSRSIFFKEDRFQLVDNTIRIVRPDEYHKLMNLNDFYKIKEAIIDIYWGKVVSQVDSLSVGNKFSVKNKNLISRQSMIDQMIDKLKESEKYSQDTLENLKNELLNADLWIQKTSNISEIMKKVSQVNYVYSIKR